MPNFTVEIKNLPQIKAAFAREPVQMTQNLNNAIRKSIFTIQRESMEHTPVDTGRLRASHTTLFENLKGQVEPTAFYAIFVHEGTKFMKGRPFLLNAVKTKQEEVQKFFDDAVRDVMDRLGDQT